MCGCALLSWRFCGRGSWWARQQPATPPAPPLAWRARRSMAPPAGTRLASSRAPGNSRPGCGQMGARELVSERERESARAQSTQSKGSKRVGLRAGPHRAEHGLAATPLLVGPICAGALRSLFGRRRQQQHATRAAERPRQRSGAVVLASLFLTTKLCLWHRGRVARILCALLRTPLARRVCAI